MTVPSLPPPLPPTDYPVLIRRSTTWLPETVGVSKTAIREARKLASTITFAVGRREAVARHLLALACCRVGRTSFVARIPLFQAPGLLLADPRREAFYWSLDPGVPGSFEERAGGVLADLLRAEGDAAAAPPPHREPERGVGVVG